jgi:hypothetical protein
MARSSSSSGGGSHTTESQSRAAAASILFIVALLAAPLVTIFRSISNEEAELMTGQCHVLSSLSEAVLAFLAYLLAANLVRERVLPVCFASSKLLGGKDPAAIDRWCDKITSLLLPIAVRGLCFLLLLPGWSFFSFDVGLVLNTTTASGHCNLESDGVSAARAFYTARYALCALMLFELAASRSLHWSVMLHHVVTVVACAVTTDTVLLSVVGGEVRGATADGVGFVTFFYAALTTFEMILVLRYHLLAGQSRLKQAASMAAAAALQVVVTTAFFIVFPCVLLARTASTLSAPLLALLVLVNLVMYVVELFIASVRVAIARKKWREHRESAGAAPAAVVAAEQVSITVTASASA